MLGSVQTLVTAAAVGVISVEAQRMVTAEGPEEEADHPAEASPLHIVTGEGMQGMIMIDLKKRLQTDMTLTGETERATVAGTEVLPLTATETEVAGTGTLYCTLCC